MPDDQFDPADAHVFMLTLKDGPRGNNFIWACGCGASGKGRKSEAKHREKHTTKEQPPIGYYVPQADLEAQEERTRECQELISEYREKVPPKEWLVLSHKTLRALFHEFLEATYVDDFEEYIQTEDNQSAHVDTINHAHRLIDNPYFQLAFAKKIEQMVEAERHE